MTKQALVNWLKLQQPTLETILLSAAKDFCNSYSSHGNFSYDTRKTGQEMWLLRNGEDLCYDRPTIGFNYSLWYHPKRINTFLRFFTDLLFTARQENRIEIFDLGAGTGAVLWAVGLVTEGMKAVGLQCPEVRVINVDTSPFMISYNYFFLWKHFVVQYPGALHISTRSDYKINSWHNVDETGCSNVWLCASYLFDHSENAESIASDFIELTQRYRPNRILLLSSVSKKSYCDLVANKITELNFSSNAQSVGEQIYSGLLNELGAFRNGLSEKYALNLQGTPSWNVDSLYGRILHNNAPQLNMDFHKLNLFVGPEKDRTRIQLTKEQNEASQLTNRPTLIVGPAGSGKSVVLTQKVVNIVNERLKNQGYDPDLKILVTTFNKGLVRYLGDWIEQLLDGTKVIRSFTTTLGGGQSDYSFFKFRNSTRTNIYVMHFDVLPTKIGRIGWHRVTPAGVNVEIEDFHLYTMERAVEEYVKANGVDIRKYEKILNAGFLLEEYHRVIYGNMCNSYIARSGDNNSYSTIARDGRGNVPQLRFQSERRKIVWGIVSRYLRSLNSRQLESFTMRRHRFAKRLLKDGYTEKFSHILVDEFQDCTKTDYEIFYQLLTDPNHLTLGGDIAQSIHLGAALHVPRADEQGNFSRKKLDGSFRLPFRVSECIRPLSQMINKDFGERHGLRVDIINPYKGAPPGSRPILVYAKDTEEAANKIADVFDTYNKLLRLGSLTIFERDLALCAVLREKQVEADTEIILRAKGLEKSCVVWSTRIDVDSTNEKKEFVYTILTRTVSLLIIVMFPDMNATFSEIIKSFVHTRVITWDKESEDRYTQIRFLGEFRNEEFDEDNSEDNSKEEDGEDLDSVFG